MRFDSYLPTRLYFGPGRVEEVGELASSLGRRALVVTSRSAMKRLGYSDRLLKSLADAGIATAVFHDLDVTPTTDDVDRAAENARTFGAEFVIGMGGGSALDCAKAVAAVVPKEIGCAEYLHGRAAIGPETLPILAIPTTAGTGSDMNRSAIITDVARRRKDALRSDHLFPRIALVDPALTHDAPAEITAQTGFDALAHAVESYVSPRAQPWADALALKAIETVLEALPIALKDPHNASARLRLCLAASSMGYNLSCVGTCLPHRLDKPLCAFHPQIAHGQAIAFFYPAWVEYSWRGNPERFALLASMFDPTLAGRRIDHAAESAADCFAKFIRSIGLGRSLASFGVNLGPDDAIKLAQRASGDLQINPVPVEPARLAEFYRFALQERVV